MVRRKPDVRVMSGSWVGRSAAGEGAPGYNWDELPGKAAVSEVRRTNAAE
jgi:hypothetical protein